MEVENFFFQKNLLPIMNKVGGGHGLIKGEFSLKLKTQLKYFSHVDFADLPLVSEGLLCTSIA